MKGHEAVVGKRGMMVAVLMVGALVLLYTCSTSPTKPETVTLSGRVVLED